MVALAEMHDRQRERTVEALATCVRWVKVGAWSLGFGTAKLLAGVLTTIGAVFVAGWLCGRTWPALRWLGAAWLVGWESARTPADPGARARR